MKINKLGFVAGTLAALITFNGSGSYTQMASAETVESSQYTYHVSNDEILLDRVSYAQVDMSCFTNTALDYVDEYVTLDEDGKFYITDEKTLSNLLTPEQYVLVEEQIEAVNLSNALYAATGSESNPYELTDGKLTKVSASSEYWFSCKTWGATDFSLSSTSSGSIIIYKKTLFGKDKISSSSNVKSKNLTLSNCEINNGANTYLVVITPGSSSTLSAKIAQHRDKNNVSSYLTYGGMWKPNSKSAIPDSNILYQKYWYVPKESVSILVDYIMNDKFIEYQQALVDGTITATSIATALFPGSVAKAAGIIASCVGLLVPDFKTDMINKIQSAAGYSNGTYTKGVLLIEYMYTPQALTFQDIESWNGGTMYGPEGWTGSWTRN